MGEWLYSLIPWGSDAIVWVQSFRSGFLDSFFTLFTLLGEEYFIIAFLPVVYWCVDKPLGIRLSYVVLLSNYLNGLAKMVYAVPRPADPRIAILRHESSPSFPSGHAQNAVALWGYLAVQIRRAGYSWVLPALLILTTLLIAFSRIYLGVHFPQDTIGGILIGILLLVLFIGLVEKPFLSWFRRQSFPLKLVLAVLFPTLMLLLPPADWSGRYPGEVAAMVSGTLLGANIGFLFEGRWVRFRATGPAHQRLLRFVAGAVLIAVIYLLPRIVLSQNMEGLTETLVRLVRYGLVGFGLSFIAPWLFVRLRLAGSDHHAAVEG